MVPGFRYQNLKEGTARMPTQRIDLDGTNLLFVAYFYPPAASTEVPGSMRTIKFIRHLKNGARHVLTHTADVAPGDNALAHLSLPVNDETVHRVRSWDIFRLLLAVRAHLQKLAGRRETGRSHPPQESKANSAFTGSGQPEISQISLLQRIKDFIYNTCYFPDHAGPWILPAVLKGVRLVRRYHLDCIFATGSPWSGLTVGLLVSRLTGKPLIADFRDPWVNNPFHMSKGAILDRLGHWLEAQVVRRAAAVSLNTDALREEFLSRYPDQVPDHFFVMPNGIDASDFAQASQPEHRNGSRHTLTLCHAGFLYGVRDPSSLLEALRIVNRDLVPYDRRVVFRQIGKVSLNYDVRERYADLIEQQTFVLEPAQPYQSCLASMVQSDIVVNIQSGTKTQIPSKLYDYLAIERPILHITPDSGALGTLVKRYQLGQQLDFSDVPGLVSYLRTMSDQLAEHGRLDEHYASRDQFLIENITADLVRRIHQVTGSPSA